jgi:ketosteroid isomerase-like protein
MTRDDYYEGRRPMTSEEYAQAQYNKEVVRNLYDAILRPEGPDWAAIKAAHADEYSVEFNWGHPDYRGKLWNAENNMDARMRLIKLTASDSKQATIDAILADGPTRVVSLITNAGADLSGKPWKTTVVQVLELTDGKITSERMFFQDQVLLRDIALEREAAESVAAQS